MTSADKTKWGKVALVGAGPGDPGLLTLRGKALLQTADTVVYDYLANPALLDFTKAEAERIYVGKKRGASNIAHQEKINEILIQSAKAGKSVVRLKGGDPFIFGRGGEEIEALAAEAIPFEVVPGVTSAIGVPAYAGIPLTHRKMASSVTLVTGHEDPEKGGSHLDWAKLATGSDTLVLLMAMGNLSAIVHQLVHHGRPEDSPVALIAWGTYARQQTVCGTLKNIEALRAEKNLKPPVVMVVGDVVSLRSTLNWFENLPLFGKRIVVTRAAAQAQDFVRQLSEQGAEPLVFPTLEIVPPPAWDALDAAIGQIESYDTLIFTSVNGVAFFRRRLRELRKDLRLLKGIFICAIGPGTAKALEDWDLRVDLIPDEFKAEGLLEKLAARGVPGRRFLIPRALEAREILPDELRRLGGTVDVVPAYQAVRPVYSDADIAGFLGRGPIDVLTFASASTLHHFVEIIGQERFSKHLKTSAVAVIGPITAAAAKDQGLEVDIIPKSYTFSSITEAIMDYYQTKR
ncbi:MAG: uroporphyrinogen-III C-methyltransferase [Nitrospiria bacterium]